MALLNELGFNVSALMVTSQTRLRNGEIINLGPNDHIFPASMSSGLTTLTILS